MEIEPKPIKGAEFRAVFRAFTGLYNSDSEAARDLGLKPAALQGWKIRKTIPAQHVEKIRRRIDDRAFMILHLLIPSTQP